jgi:hypothetical protein
VTLCKGFLCTVKPSMDSYDMCIPILVICRKNSIVQRENATLISARVYFLAATHIFVGEHSTKRCGSCISLLYLLGVVGVTFARAHISSKGAIMGLLSLVGLPALLRRPAPSI